MPRQNGDSGGAGQDGVASEGFPVTVWEDVRRARDRDGVIAIASLARIANRYWYPVYYLIRHKGHHKEETMRLTREFFTSFLEADLLSQGGVGKFRAFLVDSINRFLDPDRPRAKEGTREVQLPLPDVDPENWRAFEPSEGDTPEDVFTKNWAKFMIDTCVATFREECLRVNKRIELRLFEARYLHRERSGVEDIARSLNLSVTEANDYLQGAMRRFRRIVREEAMTWVSSPEEGLEEVGDLLAGL